MALSPVWPLSAPVWGKKEVVSWDCTNAHLPHASTAHAPSHATTSSHHPPVKPTPATPAVLPPSALSRAPISSGFRARVATPAHAILMVLSVTTCERKLSHVFTFVYNSLCQAITSRLTILTGWFIVCLAIASSSTGLLAVLASRGLSVGTRRWGVAGRRSLFLLGRSLLISSLLAVGALLCVASLLALVSSLLLRIGVLLRLLGIRALLISRRLLAGRTVAAEGHKLQSVTNKIHCKTLWDYEEKSKPNTWRVQQKQPVVHIQDMQTGHYSWPAHYKAAWLLLVDEAAAVEES